MFFFCCPILLINPQPLRFNSDSGEMGEKIIHFITSLSFCLMNDKIFFIFLCKSVELWNDFSQRSTGRIKEISSKMKDFNAVML